MTPLETEANPNIRVGPLRWGRPIAGFEEIQHFVETNGRPPQNGESQDIFERIYAVRLEQIRKQPDCYELVSELDTHGLLDGEGVGSTDGSLDDFDDDELAI